MLMDIKHAKLPFWFLHLDIVVLAYSCNKRTVILAMKQQIFLFFLSSRILLEDQALEEQVIFISLCVILCHGQFCSTDYMETDDQCKVFIVESPLQQAWFFILLKKLHYPRNQKNFCWNYFSFYHFWFHMLEEWSTSMCVFVLLYFCKIGGLLTQLYGDKLVILYDCKTVHGSIDLMAICQIPRLGGYCYFIYSCILYSNFL